MKSKENFVKRIEAIQRFLTNNPRSKFVDICEAFPNIKPGTLSCNLSLMTQSGHLTRNEFYQYSAPAVLSTANKIIGDITKMQKLKYSKQSESKPSDLFNAPSNPDKILSIQKQIEQAVALLKSQGYKVLAKKTEYTEI